MTAGVLLGWLALALALGSGALWFRRAMQVQIPESRAGFVATWVAAGLLGAAAFWQGAGWLGGVPAGLAILVAAFVSFTVAISRQVTEGAIRVGDVLPHFTAPDDTGAPFDIAKLQGRPVLLKFFRGHW